MLDAVRPSAAAHLVGLSSAGLVLNAFTIARPRGLSGLAPSGVEPHTMRAAIRTLGCIPLVSTLLDQRLRRQHAARMVHRRAPTTSRPAGLP
ncbi:MAG: hypothetical protein P8R54_30365 [Myxococcota bacterium]|nr:hypothetical protein [Myxococcota bacterium]